MLLIPSEPALVLVATVVVAFGLGGAALDGREATHQYREGQLDLVAVAILVAVLHLAAASIAVVLAARSRSEASQPEL